MSSLFADTHNVVSILEKSDAAKGFEQIIDFLSRSYIHYALTMNPHIYVSCIKQFWNTASVKRSDDVTRLQTLVDKKKDYDLRGKSDASEGFAQIIDFLSGSYIYYALTVPTHDDVDQENVTKEITDDVAQPTSPLPPSPQVLDKCFALVLRVKGLETANTAQQLEILKLKARVKKLERLNKVIPAAKPAVVAVSTPISAAKPAAKPKVRRKGVIIRDPEEELSLKTPVETPKVKDKDKGILVETPKPLKKKDQIEMDAEYAKKLQEINKDYEKFSKDIDWDAAMDHPMKKKDQIELDVEYARKLHEEINKDYEEINKDIDWDAAINHVKQKSKNPQYIKRYQVMKKRPQTESEARKNMMIYSKNTAGYKLDFFKGMSYDEIYPIFQARFDANMRFLFKSREEMEEKDQEADATIYARPGFSYNQLAIMKKTKANENILKLADDQKELFSLGIFDDDFFFILEHMI
nr:hypothetical protein [Tanacetum cinerariifolium]